ncbi:hypothetical protein RND71_010062 [Anisodus tanguticus]|uniref:Uncharacterized protein n=1 Tax=Anisodus tanguticus TaxID=243964 RepID=A0AAE1SIY2_9SOLA|nr:hypothetical protein RND71_010062 [Anisodus tanguticus]
MKKQRTPKKKKKITKCNETKKDPTQNFNSKSSNSFPLILLRPIRKQTSKSNNLYIDLKPKQSPN